MAKSEPKFIQRGFGDIWGTKALTCEFGAVRFGFYSAENIEIEPHVHEDAHLIFVLEGNYITSAAGAPPVTAAPILVDNPAGTAHRDRFLNSKGRFLAINIAPELSREGNARISRHPADLVRMIEVIQELEFRKPTLTLEEVAAAVLEHDAVKLSPAEPPWLTRAYEKIMEERPGVLTLSGLAKEADVHPVHLARVFRRTFGRTAGQLLRDRQFEQACDRLLMGTDPIAEIALDAGFHDQSHFSRFFSRRTGSSPGRYRRAATKV